MRILGTLMRILGTITGLGCDEGSSYTGRLWKKIPLSRCSNTAWDNTQRYKDSRMSSTQDSHVLVLFPKSVLFMHCLYIIQAQQCSLSARGHYVGPCLIAAHILYEMHLFNKSAYLVFPTYTLFRIMEVLEWVLCVSPELP